MSGLKPFLNLTCSGFSTDTLKNSFNESIAKEQFRIIRDDSSQMQSINSNKSNNESMISLDHVSLKSGSFNTAKQKPSNAIIGKDAKNEVKVLKNVQITHIHNPALFYIQTNSLQQDFVEFYKQTAELADMSAHPNKINVGQKYLVKRDKLWLRVTVLKQSTLTTFTCFFMDHGLTDEVNAGRYLKFSVVYLSVYFQARNEMYLCINIFLFPITVSRN